ncbi:MAG: AAA family ATPase, partial [Myxococcales bacterium]|nr:AAA family ATPase [Myxococcales bacterium]
TADKLTQVGTMIGTPHFMSPEQILGTAPMSPASDVFSLGVMFFEMLAGERAYQGDDVVAVVAKIALTDAPRLSEVLAEVPADLDALVAQAMAKRPADRFHTARELADAIDALAPLTTIPTPVPASRTYHDEETETLVAPALVAERRVVSMLFGHLPPGAEDSAKFALIAESLSATHHRLLSLVEVAVFGAHKSTGDEAIRAIRMALAVRAAVPGSRLAVSTGRALSAPGELSRDAIERGAQVVETATPDVIELDETTARLLGDTFVVEGMPPRLRLVTEPRTSGTHRILLGRVTPCVGREQELDLLSRLYGEVVRGSRSRAALVLGPGGIGKSRLSHELLRRLARTVDAPRILRARPSSLGETTPLGVVSAMLREIGRIRVDDEASVREAKLRTTVREGEQSRLVPLLTALASLGQTETERALDAVLVSDRLREAFEAWLAQLTRERPVLLLLEDLHYCDSASLSLIDGALKNLPGLFVLGLGRPETLERQPKLFATRARMLLHLTGLDPGAAATLVREMLGGVGPEVVRAVVARAEGNAFFLEELIRSVSLDRSGGDAVFESMPETLAGIVQARLDSLGTVAKRLLKAGSVFGETAWVGGIAAVTGDSEEAVSASMAELVRTEILELLPRSRFHGHVEVVFRHALLRDAAYELWFEHERAEAHRLAALWLEQNGERDPLTLARHFARGGLPTRAIPHFLAAAEAALTGSDFEGATASAERALASGASGILRGRLLLTIAEAKRWQGDLEGALAAATDAAVLFPPGSRFWFGAIRESVAAHGRLGHKLAILPLGTRALAVAAEPGAESAQIAALVPAAVHLLYVGESSAARELAQRIEALEAKLPHLEALARARVCQLRAALALHGRDLEIAAREQEAARVAFELSGDTRAAALASAKLGFTLLELGEHERAEEVLRATLATAQRLGLATIEPLAMQNLGMVLARRGELSEAAALQMEAVERFDARKDPRLAGASRLHLAMALLGQGDRDRAREEAERVLGSGFEPLHVGAWAVISMLELRRGNVEAALAAGRSAVELLGRLGSVE